MINHKKVLALALTAILSGLYSNIEAKTILLVPQDDRPVSFDYTVSTAEKAGYTILTPPRAFLSGKNYRGYPDQIWNWLIRNMDQADAAIISTDSLIYGGLVDSRKHNEALSILMARENKIRQLHARFPKIPIYGFGTIMRTPYASKSGVEPYYYSKYGNDIYRLSGLQDKMDSGNITTDEAGELLSLKLSIPSEYLQDWFKRRTKNNTINRMLIKDTRDGIFTYFCEGHDDNSKNSQSSLEYRYLSIDANKLPETKYGSFPGADQLALLLIARYHNDEKKLKPTFSVIYPLGRAEDTVPSYESQPIGKTIREHITAAGGTMAGKNIPDIVLAVNTPISSTGESGQFNNFGMLKQSTTDFVSEIKNITERDVPVSIVDVYFANGSDNTLMNLLSKDDLLYKVTAYNGWNTASNTIGYAIAQAILAPEMSKENHKNMLTEQYIDNWAYQANVRKNIARITEKETDNMVPTPEIKEEMVAEIQEFAAKKIGLNPATISAEFPWNRLFEINALVSPSPRYPVYQTRAIKQKIAEEKAAREALEAAKKAKAAARKNNSPSKNEADNTSSGESADISTIFVNK